MTDRERSVLGPHGFFPANETNGNESTLALSTEYDDSEAIDSLNQAFFLNNN